MFDEKGRVWFTARVRPPDESGLLQEGIEPSVGEGVPARQSGRQLAMYDPKTRQIHADRHVLLHAPLQFAEDANDTLWTSAAAASGVVGWLDTKMLDETGDEEKSQGWTPLILDTNGNGKRDAYVEPDQPVDPTKDKRIVAAFYGVAVSPADGSVWGTSLGFPGYDRAGQSRRRIRRATALAEIYELPLPRAVMGRAAWTSTATAWSGRRSRAATSPASTAASARAR